MKGERSYAFGICLEELVQNVSEVKMYPLIPLELISCILLLLLYIPLSNIHCKYRPVYAELVCVAGG